jgi:hypothetical protein
MGTKGCEWRTVTADYVAIRVWATARYPGREHPHVGPRLGQDRVERALFVRRDLEDQPAAEGDRPDPESTLQRGGQSAPVNRLIATERHLDETWVRDVTEPIVRVDRDAR